MIGSSDEENEELDIHESLCELSRQLHSLTLGQEKRENDELDKLLEQIESFETIEDNESLAF